MSTLITTSFLNDKPDSFAKIQQKYFARLLHPSEQVTLTYEEFQAICYDSHELGRLRERALKRSSLHLG